MGFLFDILSFLIKTISYQYAFKRAKKKGLLLYLKALQTVRKSLGFALLTLFVLQMMILGFFGALVSGVWLLPIEESATKIWILFGVFSAFFLIPAGALMFLLSEKVWFKYSGAEQVVKSQSSDLQTNN